MTDEGPLTSGVANPQTGVEPGSAAVRDARRLAEVFSGAPIGVGFWSPQGQLLHANPVLCDLLAQPRDALLGADIERFVDGAEVAEMRDCIGRLVHGDLNAFECELSCRGLDDEELWLTTHVTAIYGGDGGPEVLLTQIFDFTDARTARSSDAPRVDGDGLDDWVATLIDGSAEIAAGSRADQLARVLDAGSDYLMIVERNLAISYVNEAASKVLGIEVPPAEGRPPTLLMDVLGPESFKQFHETVEPALVAEGIWRGELELRCVGDQLVPASVVFLAHNNEAGRIESISAVARDISDLKAAQAKLQELATHDYLTGLPNRILLYDRLEHAVARFQRYGQPVALLYLDLDHFKPVNDALGHHVGDAVLVKIADRIHSVVRDTDTAARLGGDEFAVLVEGVSDVELLRGVAGRLIRGVCEPITIGEADASVSVSVGLVVADGTCSEPDALMALADAAVYRAKAAGRGRFVELAADGHEVSA